MRTWRAGTVTEGPVTQVPSTSSDSALEGSPLTVAGAVAAVEGDVERLPGAGHRVEPGVVADAEVVRLPWRSAGCAARRAPSFCTRAWSQS